MDFSPRSAPDGGPDVRAPRVLTVGHSNHTPDRLLSLLRQHGVTVVADVRSQPYSRFASQFNREQLEVLVKDAGLDYVFLGRELGGRILGLLSSQAERIDRTDEVLALPAFEEGIGRLVKGVSLGYRIAMLCAEEDPTECHRRVWVTCALKRRGLAVGHIRGDGRVVPDDDLPELTTQPELF